MCAEGYWATDRSIYSHGYYSFRYIIQRTISDRGCISVRTDKGMNMLGKYSDMLLNGIEK